MKQIISIIGVLVLTALSQLVQANNIEQYSNLRFNTFSTHEGLSQSSVLSIAQDSDGFIWLGTKDGLNKFDGYNFFTYKNSPDNAFSISNNEIIFLQSDTLGNMFIGTRGGGLNYYVKSQNKFIRYAQMKTPDGTVTSLHQCPDGTIWVGTSEGLFRGIPDSQSEFNYQFTNYSKNSVYLDSNEKLIPFNSSIISVVSIKQLSTDMFLIGTFQGLFMFKLRDLSFTQIDIGIHNKAKINAMVSDFENNIWAATSEGLLKLTIENNTIIDKKNMLESNRKWNNLSTKWVESIICDFEGNIWAGTRGAGVIKIVGDNKIENYSNNTSFSNRIGDNIINSMMIDKSGILWMGTESRGVVTLDLYRKRFNHLENNTVTGRSLTSNLVTAITGKNNILWVGTAYNGLDYLQFNPDNTITTTHFNQIPTEKNVTSSEIISLSLDQDNVLWIGTASNNLVTYKASRGFKSYYTGSFAFALHHDRQGGNWIGTWGKGLIYIEREGDTMKYFTNNPADSRSISGDIILSVFDDNQGNLWVGTKGRGLNVIPIKSIKQGYNNFVSFEKNDNFLHNDVYCILQDKEDVLWIGTGGGLMKLDIYSNQNAENELYKGRANFTTYTEADGLPANLIYGILEDDYGNLWISTTKGLSKFDKSTKKFQNFNSNDGLQSNEFHSNAFYASPNNQLFFGGINGLSFFNPSDINPDLRPLDIVISNLKVGDTPIKPFEKIKGKVILTNDISKTQKITLHHKHKDFSIDFTAQHFNNLEGVTYAYRLLGFNDEWRYLPGDEHSVSYTNLWEGEYTFQVKSTNNDGYWNNEIRQLDIVVQPPYWRSNWSYAVYALIFILGLLLFRRYTLIGVAEKNKLQIEHIERNNLIENTEAKMRFFTNISHEIRTPLTLISNPLEEVINSKSIDEKSRNNLKLVAKNVNRLLHLTNQLLQLRKIDKEGIEASYSEVNLVQFTKEIISFFLQKALNKEITLSFQSEIDPDEKIWIDTELITTAFYNVISNAYKFTPSKGSIVIKISKEKDQKKRINKIRKKRNSEHKQWYSIEICDTGIGIAPDDIEKIFHRFYQSKNEYSHEKAGSGIGLSIVKEYIDLHNGKIDIKSKPGEGTTFKILLPEGSEHVNKIKTETENDNTTSKLENLHKQSQKNDHAEIIPDIQNDNMTKILLVEDDKDLCEYIKNTLSDNYSVHTANNGKKGIEAALEIIPDLIISDIMMPEANGYELCQTIKNNETTQHIPIVLLTARAADENKIEGYKSGADMYVTKPFKIEILKSQIHQLIHNRKTLSDIFSKQIFLKPSNINISSADEKFLTKLNDIIDEHLSESGFDVSAMVERMNQSHSTVLKKVKQLTGMSLVEFVKTYRLKRAAQILEKDNFQIAEVAYLVGFNDPKYFSKCFSKEFGKTPSEYVQEMRNKRNEEEQEI